MAFLVRKYARAKWKQPVILKRLFLLCFIVSYTPAFAQFEPDVILFNGKIVTVDARFSIAQAVAVKDGRILSVGADADILALSGGNTERIDLRGRTALPGLIDDDFKANHAVRYENMPLVMPEEMRV